MDYETFLAGKYQNRSDGFEPLWMPSFLFDFQAALVEWAIRQGRAGIFADCGLGKTPMQLVWAENVVRKTNRPVLIATPLAVGPQLLQEAEKFDVDATRSQDGIVPASARIVVTNYERVSKFDPNDFAGMVCDESSILKNFDGRRRSEITEFARTLPYRLLCTATAAPNDYTELGTSSEALGYLGHMDMLNRFFRNQQNTSDISKKWRRHATKSAAWDGKQWRFKGHAENSFWQWVCSWARALRRPSDLGFEDGEFILDPYDEQKHLVRSKTLPDGWLFEREAVTLQEQREERRRTLKERCERAAELAGEAGDQAIVWCHLNDEADYLENLIPGSLQVAGKHSDEVKEERLRAFADGELRVLVTKPKIGAWGLNLQGCAHVIYFPSHSYEQFYQAVRRCWRFGQTRRVVVDLVHTDGDMHVIRNLARKAEAAGRMFDALVAHVEEAQSVKVLPYEPKRTEVPQWL